MNKAKVKWTREELILALYLYYVTPFSKISASRNDEIKGLASIIGRSASAVALKMVNFASLDSRLKQRNISGMKNASKADSAIWNEFNGKWESLAQHREEVLINLHPLPANAETDKIITGMDIETISKTRINQTFFRKAVLGAYDQQCCITGISTPELLIASHIVPWAVDKQNRVNPCNGLCLNALHDKAFDAGLITITPDLKVKISTKIKNQTMAFKNFFSMYEEKTINLPNKFLPSPEFLDFHNKKIFRK